MAWSGELCNLDKLRGSAFGLTSSSGSSLWCRFGRWGSDHSSGGAFIQSYQRLSSSLLLGIQSLRFVVPWYPLLREAYDIHSFS